MDFFSNEEINITEILAVHQFINSEEEIKAHPVMRYRGTHQYHQLVFFLYGNNAVTFDGIPLRDEDCSIRYLPARKTDDYTVRRFAPDCCIDVYFTADCGSASIAKGFYGKDDLRDKFVKIFNLWNGKKPGYYAKCMEQLYGIISSLKEEPRTYIPKARRIAMENAHNYIISHYTDKDFDYKKLSSESGFSYSHFKKLFVARHGMTPNKYVTNLRLNHAVELLISDAFTITQIAGLCGFENVYYFSTVFKKHFGVSPNKYTEALSLTPSQTTPNIV